MTRLERETIEMEIEVGADVTVEMAQGLVARLEFVGEAGQRVTIAARDNLGAGVDPLLALLGVDGHVRWRATTMAAASWTRLSETTSCRRTGCTPRCLVMPMAVSRV